MADSSTDRSDDASPGLSTAVMRASLSQRLFDEPAPAVSIDRFRILRVVGQGAVGTVYEAYDPRLDRRLALKLVRGDLPERAQQLLLDEARTLAQVSHPNVVTVYDAGTALERVYIAMEFVSGGALVDWLDAQDRRTDEILAAFVQAGRGLVAAHGVGIVHRDFKPSNVMREEDGRVKVGDFGLARALAADSIPSMHDGSPAGSSSGTGLTTSNVAGTPAYMAPEALDGRIDPRSDQFSFCVALWEALFGKRPPAGVEALAREDALPAGGDRDVPRRVVSAVLRGLSVEPEARWPSMQALLSALESRPGSSAWRGIAVLGVGGVVGALAFDAEPEPCGVDPQALRGVWDEARRADGASAFDAHAAPYAAQTWSRVAGRLDDYVERWSDTRRRACEASLIDRERSPEAYDLASACLQIRRDALGALVDLLIQADAQTVERAVMATAELPAPEDCEDPSRLRAWGLLPPDPQTREAIDVLRRGLSRVRSQLELGRHAEAGAELEPLIEQAVALDVPRVSAETSELRGQVAQVRGEFDEAVLAFEEALEYAARGGHDHLAAGVWARLVDVKGSEQGHTEEALSLGVAARVALARVGGDPLLSASLEHALGSTYRLADDLEQAEAHHRRGLALRREQLPEDDLMVTASMNRLVGVLVHQRKADESVALITDVRDRYIAALGASHPRVAAAESNLARALATAGRMEEAIEPLRRAIDIQTAALGREHPRTLASLGMLGTLLGQVGEAEQGIEVVEEVLEVYRARPDHPHTAVLLNNLGGLYDAAGRPEDSLRVHRQLRELLLERGEGKTANFAMNSSNLALMETDLEQFDAAEVHFAESIAVYEEVYGADHPDLWRPHAMFARLLRVTGRAKEAVAMAARAVALLEGASSDPNEVADAEFELARSRWEAGQRSADTLAFAASAAQRWRDAGLTSHAGDAEAWLSERRPAG